MSPKRPMPSKGATPAKKPSKGFRGLGLAEKLKSAKVGSAKPAAEPVKAKGLGIMGGMPTKPFGDRAQRNAKSDSAVAKKQPGSQMRAKMEAAKAKTENYVAKAQAKRAAEKTSGGLGSAGPKRTPAQGMGPSKTQSEYMAELQRQARALQGTPTGPVPASSVMMKKGGMCKTKKYARGGGIEVRGKTKGKLI